MKIFDLYENAVTEDELITLCEGEFDEAFKRGLDGYFIFKGLTGPMVENDVLKLEPVKDRRSANTKNYYTLWINHNEHWASFPTRSVIASANHNYAMVYGKVYVILPKNGTDIAICPSNDFWASFDENYPPNYINRVTHILLTNTEIIDYDTNTYSELLEAFDKFDNLDSDVKRDLIDEYTVLSSEYNKIILNDGLRAFYERYYTNDDFSIQKISSYNEVNNREVWFDNEFLAIEYSFAETFFSNARRSGI